MGVPGGLHELAGSTTAAAQRLDPRVVDVGQVGGQPETEHGHRDQGPAQRPRAHRDYALSDFSTASSKLAGSVSEVYSSFFIAPPDLPTRNDGVPVKPTLFASWVSVASWAWKDWSARADCHWARFRPGVASASPWRDFSVT